MLWDINYKYELVWLVIKDTTEKVIQRPSTTMKNYLKLK